jgi:hypothetical protein
MAKFAWHMKLLRSLRVVWSENVYSGRCVDQFRPSRIGFICRNDLTGVITSVRKREVMSADAIIKLGNRATAILLFSYPNAGHEDQTLEETIEHYFNDSLRREELAAFQVVADISDDCCQVRIAVADDGVADQIARRYQAFFDIGKIGLQDVAAFRDSGKWDTNWRFFLPLGVPIALLGPWKSWIFPRSLS